MNTRIRIIPWAMVLLLQNLKMLQEQSGGQPSSKLNQLFSTRLELDLSTKRREIVLLLRALKKQLKGRRRRILI